MGVGTPEPEPLDFFVIEEHNMIEASWIERMMRRVRTVYKFNKTEMLTMAALGFIAGAVIF